MSGRDHSYTCAECGCERGGMNDLRCACMAGPQGDVCYFERDPRGQQDAGAHVAAKPCCARMNTIPVSWCTRPDSHDGPCSAPVFGVIESDDLGPAASKRRRW